MNFKLKCQIGLAIGLWNLEHNLCVDVKLQTVREYNHRVNMKHLVAHSNKKWSRRSPCKNLLKAHHQKKMDGLVTHWEDLQQFSKTYTRLVSARKQEEKQTKNHCGPHPPSRKTCNRNSKTWRGEGCGWREGKPRHHQQTEVGVVILTKYYVPPRNQQNKVK